jgi:hypothetical protein|tara:strand:+ start:2874 stop:3089 length:216 start_codon:yes stop_codon:yes gene_type:complete
MTLQVKHIEKYVIPADNQIVYTLDEFLVKYPNNFMLASTKQVAEILSRLDLNDSIGLQYDQYIDLEITKVS